MGDPKTLGTIQALAADGAYGKALKHLLSERMLDANDPAIVSHLQTLNPPAAHHLYNSPALSLAAQR
jgi:hypothetical protein